MKVKNTANRSLGLPLGETTVLKPGEEFPIDAIQRSMLEAHPLSNIWIAKGLISFGDKPPKKKHLPKVRRMRDHDPLPVGCPDEGTVLFHHGGGWYSVYNNGMHCTDEKVRKAEGEAIAADYLDGDELIRV